MTVGSGPIVCGVDFSEASRHALRHASALAARLGQSLIVVSVIDPLIAEAATSMSAAPFIDRARNDLDSFVQGSVDKGAGAPAVTLQMPAGTAAQELLAAATKAAAGLIVIGTEGLGRARRMIFGSTTLRVMRGAHRPLLAVPPASGPDPIAITHIVCGIDFGEPSRRAAAEAVALGRALNVPVTLLHAVGRLTMPSVWDVMLTPTDEEREARAKANLAALAAAVGSPEPAIAVAIGEPSEVVAQHARPGALLVLGLGDLSGHRPGSTALRIMAETHLPVLGVPLN